MCPASNAAGSQGLLGAQPAGVDRRPHRRVIFGRLLGPFALERDVDGFEAVARDVVHGLGGPQLHHVHLAFRERPTLARADHLVPSPFSIEGEKIEAKGVSHTVLGGS